MSNYDESTIRVEPQDSMRNQRKSLGQIYFDYTEPQKSFHALSLSTNIYSRNFITGSFYKGQWNPLGMNGHGTYNLLHGVIYEGRMKDGQFHGEGKLIYPNGQQISGIFYRGTIVSTDFKFSDGQQCVLEEYCKFPDRRYMSTIQSGQFLPPGRERLTNIQPTRKIPKGHYDVGDGFYDPKTKWVYKDLTFDSHEGGIMTVKAPLRFVKPMETEHHKPEKISLIQKFPFVPVYQDEEFVLKHCRKEWDEPTGYRPDLYEVWLNGRKEQVEKYRKKHGYSIEGENDMSTSVKLLHYMKEIYNKNGEKYLHFSDQVIEDERQKSID